MDVFNALSNGHRGEHRERVPGWWEEGGQVSLVEELPAIHARNCGERVQQEAGGKEDEY